MSIEMKLELGHRASVRDKPTPEGFTHDWVVFVKGAEGTDINHFVDKVVFHLHESFPKPRRVVKESPYQVAESGYAGFMMPIEVYFRSKEEPKKVHFEYDLFLRLEGLPVYNIRREKLTFQNPSEDFRRKLLLAKGGINTGSAGSIGTPSLQTQSGASVLHTEETSRIPTTHTKHTPVAEKKIKSHSTSKESSHSSHTKQNKILPPPSVPVSSSNKEPKSSSKVNHSPELKESKSKSSKSEKEPKLGSKRPHPSDNQNHHSSEKKKRHHSNSDANEKHNDNNEKTKEVKEKKEKHKSSKLSSSHGIKKEKHKSSHSHSNKDLITKSPSKSLNSLKSPSNRLSNEDSNDAKPMKPTIKDSNSPLSDLVNAAETWCEISPEKMDPTIEKEMLSPMSPDVKPSLPEKNKQNNHHDSDNSIDEKPSKLKNDKSPKLKNQKSKKLISPIATNNTSSSSTNRNVKQNGAMKEPNNHMSPPPPVNKTIKSGKEKETLDPAYIRELIDLQKKIMALEDRNLLQKVVDVIQETGLFQMTSKSFDFDLCSLDQSTVRKLKLCLSL